MIDESVLHDVLVKYKKFLSTKDWGKEELYKWKAIKTFQDNWNLDADNFSEMLERSLSETKNLLDTRYNFPRAMIVRMAEWAPNEVRYMFGALFNENDDVCARIEEFKQTSLTIFQKYNHGEGNHFQDEHAISVYLWLQFPNKYYIYQYGIVKEAASRLNTGLIFKQGQYQENMRIFYSFYDELCNLLKQDNELQNLLKDHLAGNTQYSPDPELKTLTVDFGHYVGRTLSSSYFNGEKNSSIPNNSKEDQMDSQEQVETNKEDGTAKQQYWWLVANPKLWTISDMKIDEVQSYTLYNDEGRKRRIFQNFLNAKVGDQVIGYESTPTKQVVCLLSISKENDGNSIDFKKVENLSSPIDYSVLKNTPGLENLEYFKNQQGSFFKLTADEYDIIMELIRSENPLPKQNVNEPYDKNKFLDEVFVTYKDYDQLENLLLRKKNLILQGAPGVGKTFAAKRLAYAIMGEKDDNRVVQVQFHQNYSYEDFVMGYKPNEEGGFELKNGIFYKFCKRAAADREHKYFFIIDEINRGNLSKIFGELLMLIENDYRDKPILMSYREEHFAVPSNVYIIGMMNTADRSLAMIDYALRRRFSFFEMKPGFESPQFKEYVQKLMDPHLTNLVKAIVELNKVIANDDSLGAGFCIGHSYLCNLGFHDNLENIVEYDIIPMLREYWFDNDNLFNQEAQKLRNSLKL